MPYYVIPNLKSIKPIEHQFCTGEEPVLVLCSDMNSCFVENLKDNFNE